MPFHIDTKNVEWNQICERRVAQCSSNRKLKRTICAALLRLEENGGGRLFFKRWRSMMETVPLRDAWALNIWGIAAFAAILCVFPGATASAQSVPGEASSTPASSTQTNSEQVISAQQAERKAYSNKISEGYNCRFGKDRPFMPGNFRNHAMRGASLAFPCTKSIHTTKP